MTQPSQPSALTYVIVWLALASLATLSLLASYAHLGDWNVVFAFAIATVKAGLVFAVFMHLMHGPPLHRIVIVVAMCFVALIILGVLADVATRSVASPYALGSRDRRPTTGVRLGVRRAQDGRPICFAPFASRSTGSMQAARIAIVRIAST